MVKRIAHGFARPRVLVATAGVALVVAPSALAFGEGKEVDGGKRNPSSNGSLSYSNETEIIANNSTYGTRQSNKSTTGGGAIYGCRAVLGKNPCLRANNLNKGLAFQFVSGGPYIGQFIAGVPGDRSKPFVTNATGVATGLNADRIDGIEGKDIATKADVATAGALKFAVVGADGKLGNQRGATASKVEGGSTPVVGGVSTYSVSFDADVSKCSFTATRVGDPSTDGSLGVNGAKDPKVVEVKAPKRAPFHLQVVC